jgi:dihydrofolate synthase/folylpolyglutamate synthase
VTYAEALDWIHGAQFTGIKLGLENTRALLAASGNPEKNLRFLHVAGTNGKGSVCAMLDSALRKAGHRCGLYTSPHLVDFRERIRVDGEMAPPDAVAGGLARLREVCGDGKIPATFFEIGTVLALDFFARSGCGVVVLETGMGGRLDATNAVAPLASVLTPIGMDHSEWLGDTLEKIAFEKAGIIKPGVPVVCSPQPPEAETVFRKAAAERGAPIHFVEQPWHGEVGLAGEHQKWNAALALAAIEASGLPCGVGDFADGMKSVHWPGRFQRFGGSLVVDGAHNPHSAETLVATWRSVFGEAKAVVVFGSLADKDSGAMLRILEQVARKFVFVPVKNPRGTPPESLSSGKPFCVAPSLAAGLAVAKAAGGPVLVCGSLYLAGEALGLPAVQDWSTQSA